VLEISVRACVQQCKTVYRSIWCTYNVKSDQQVREYTRKLPENLLWGQILFTVLLIVTLTKMSVTFLFHCVDACFGFLVVSLLRLVCDLGKIMLM
jgi:fatty-acid desaturase